MFRLVRVLYGRLEQRNPSAVGESIMRRYLKTWTKQGRRSHLIKLLDFIGAY